MLIRVVTPNGYDYIKEELLTHYVGQGYVLALAEDIERTRKRVQKTLEKIFPKNQKAH